MLRVLTVLSLIFVAAPGFGAQLHADPFARLDQPSQTATVERDGVQMIAFYAKRGDLLDLTVLIKDQDGEALRTRIGLRDRQHHVLLLPSEDESVEATRIEFMRTRERIEMIVSGGHDLATFSTTQTNTHF